MIENSGKFFLISKNRKIILLMGKNRENFYLFTKNRISCFIYRKNSEKFYLMTKIRKNCFIYGNNAEKFYLITKGLKKFFIHFVDDLRDATHRTLPTSAILITCRTTRQSVLGKPDHELE
jgi:hypothetical protein